MNQLRVGVILNYIVILLNTLVGLLYTPYMLRMMGQSEYGLYQLVASVVSYLSILSLGFGSSYMRFYSRIKKNNDEQEIARFNGMFMTIFLIFAVVKILLLYLIIFL